MTCPRSTRTRALLLAMMSVAHQSLRALNARVRSGVAGLRLGASGVRLHRPQCPVCHGLVGEDDAVGLLGSRFAHAECVLVRWLGDAEGSSSLRVRRIDIRARETMSAD
jgi:hypothetical protein